MMDNVYVERLVSMHGMEFMYRLEDGHGKLYLPCNEEDDPHYINSKLLELGEMEILGEDLSPIWGSEDGKWRSRREDCEANLTGALEKLDNALTSLYASRSRARVHTVDTGDDEVVCELLDDGVSIRVYYKYPPMVSDASFSGDRWCLGRVFKGDLDECVDNAREYLAGLGVKEECL